MDSEDKFLAKVSGIQSLSSSVQSTPERHSDDASQSPELVQELGFVKSSTKKDLFRSCIDKGKKQATPSKSKMAEQPQKTCKKFAKNQDSKKPPSSKDHACSKKSNRKGGNPIRIPPLDDSLDFGNSTAWICKNTACKAKLSMDDAFCKRCSCCICHLFDDNKDPSLWLVCSTEASGDDYYCGLSCHIECALKREKVGVVNLGQLMELDGSYCCFACGKVSCILGCWRKQLAIAKEARRVDNLCERIFLSFRLLDGTSRFKELHQLVEDAKAKLESEVGPLDEDSAKTNRGFVSRLSVASEVLELCSLALEKADEWLANISKSHPSCREGSLPAACKFFFEEVTSSSVVIVLLEMPSSSTDDIKGYKLWYCRSRDESHSEDPISVFPRTERRILISNLQPCTEYSFRIRSYTETGDLGHSEAKCYTQSSEIIYKKLGSTSAGLKNEIPQIEDNNNNNKDIGSSSGFRVRNLGKVLHLAWAQEQGCNERLSGIDLEKSYECEDAVQPVEPRKDQSAPCPRELDLNVASVPDLNEELFPPFESPRNENNGCPMEQAVVRDNNGMSHETDKNGIARSHGSGNSRDWANGEVPAVNSSGETCRKRAASAIGDALDCNSTLVNGSTFRISEGLGCLDENFEYCVKTVRWLECEGHIEQEFRMKFLTWFSLRSTEKERRIVNTFIHALIDDPVSLAAQFVDSFSDSISNKRQKSGFCSELWHN